MLFLCFMEVFLKSDDMILRGPCKYAVLFVFSFVTIFKNRGYSFLMFYVYLE